MWKDKLRMAFPSLVVAAVAFTVGIALGSGGTPKTTSVSATNESSQMEENSTEQQSEQNSSEPTSSDTQVQESVQQEETIETGETAEAASISEDTNIPMVLNEDAGIHNLIATYYNAVALGDLETIQSVCDVMTETELLRFQEMAKYIEYYPLLEIYTKPGPEQGSTIAYVSYKVTFLNQEAQFPGYQAHYICTNEAGELYIKKGENTDEVNQYIITLSAQDDVVEFNNRITVEYNELMVTNPELLEYLNELDTQVSKSVGEILAQQSAENTESAENNGEAEQPPAENTEQPTGESQEQPPAENVTQYAATTTTVNVRSSDSENADKINKVTGGTRVEVLEQRVNGWSKVLVNGQEGYIKSEYLQLETNTQTQESQNNGGGETVIGTVTANTNINVRASADENADKICIFVGGDTAELLSNENGWCKINYDGKVGYVKSEFVH